MKSNKKQWPVTLVYANEMTRTVKVKASSLAKAEEKALKFHPSALGVKR